MTLLDASETLRRCEAAVAEARAFFGIDPLWAIPVFPEGAGDAPCHIKAESGYFNAPVSIDLDYYQRKPHLIRQDMAHEVAHLVTWEVVQAVRKLPDEFCDPKGGPMGEVIREAIENATVRLERLFMRERPEGPAP